MPKKKFEFYLILNWKKGSIKVNKRKPKEGLSDIVIKMKVDVKTPEKKEHVWKGEVEIPEAKVGQIVMDSI